jgi:RNA polymerase sigma-70 factor, ECF subfamily
MELAGSTRTRNRGSRAATRDGFNEWVRPHWSVMYACAIVQAAPGEADDVVQEALIAAWRKWAQFDAERGSPRAWLVAIVLDQARKSHRKRHAPASVDVDAPASDEIADLDLRRAVNALPPRQRLAVELHYFVQLRVTEVAILMSCSEGTVKACLSAARANLRASLGDDFR